MGSKQSVVENIDIDSQTPLLDKKTDIIPNIVEVRLQDIDELFRKNWNEFVEEKCIVARDKYTPIKTLIYAFAFHLTRNEDFMNLYRVYNQNIHPKYHSIDHLVHLHIYTLLNNMKDKGVIISCGFGPNEKNGSRYYHYIYNMFMDDRIIVGLSVERFQKAT